MKGIFIRVGLLGLILEATGIAYAAPVSSGSNVTFKGVDINSKSQCEITLGPVYLQPTATNLDYAVLGFPLPVQSPHWNVAAVKPDYTLGFDLGLRYIFKNTGNDIQLNWIHVNTSDSDSTFAGNSQFAVPLFQAGPSAGQDFNNPSQQARATAKFKYNVINLDSGQYVDFGQNVQVRFFAGLSSLQLKETLSASYQDNAHTYSINSKNISKFTGIGPLFGADALYKLPYNIGIIGTVSTSALLGRINPITEYNSNSPELADDGIKNNYQDISPKKSKQLVPSLDGKLGVNYNHSLGKDSNFTIVAGYEYATYFNALVTYNPATVFGEVNLGTIALSSLNKSVSNLSMNGPFINVSIRFS